MKSDLDYLEEALQFIEEGKVLYKLKELVRRAQDIKHKESQIPDVGYDPNWD